MVRRSTVWDCARVLFELRDMEIIGLEELLITFRLLWRLNVTFVSEERNM